MCGLTPRDTNGCLLHVTSLDLRRSSNESRCLLDARDCTLKDNMHSDELLEGKLHILASDFHQVLPAVRKGRRPDVLQACMTNSPLWKHCTTLKLRTNTRVQLKVNAADTQDKERQQTLCGLASVSLEWKVSNCQ